MKVILKEDIHKLGSLGDEVDVKPGFARNYLIPQGKALLLTRENIKQVNHQKVLLAKQRADAIERSKSLAEKIESAKLEFAMKSGESGKLFGSVTPKHVFDAMVEKGIEIDRKRLTISSPIKSLGTHTVSIKLHTEVSANLEISVVSEVLENTEEGEAPAADGDPPADAEKDKEPESAEEEAKEETK